MKSIRRLILTGLCGLACEAQPSRGQSPADEPELTPDLDAGRRNLGPDPLVLPQWLPAEAAAMEAGRPANLGGGLWTEERYPLEVVPPMPRMPEDEPVATGVPPGPLPDPVLDLYSQSPAWCVDPQHLLDARQRREIDRFLGRHAGECRQPLKLWLFAAGQTVPPAADEAAWHRASFGDARPGMLALVWMGESAATRVVFAPEMIRAHDPSALMAWRDAAVKKIALSDEPARQASELALWLAIGLAEWDAHPPALVAPAAVPTTTAPIARPPFWPGWRWLPIVGAILGMAWIAWRRRQRITGPIEFPEVDIPPRLGAPHSGGSGTAVAW